MKEAALFPPIKQFFETMGYDVKGEVVDCDMVAVGEHPSDVVVIELKTSVNLSLLLQAVDRQTVTDHVYVGIPEPRRKGSRWRAVVRLCRRLGLGIITVAAGPRAGQPDPVEIVCHPTPYAPRKSPKRRARLIAEFERRQNDVNVGGTPGQKRVTAYREDALRIALFLRQNGASPLQRIRRDAAVDDTNNRVASILQNNYYDWFARVSRGVYDVSPSGVKALGEYDTVVRLLQTTMADQ